MTRGPRTPQGIAAVTRTIERVNAERRNVRQQSTGPKDMYDITPLQPEVRALAARIAAVLEGEGQGIVRPTDRVLVELLATALALARTRLTQTKDLALPSRTLSATGNHSPGAQETGKVANVRVDGPAEGTRVAVSVPTALPRSAGRLEEGRGSLRAECRGHRLRVCALAFSHRACAALRACS